MSSEDTTVLEEDEDTTPEVHHQGDDDGTDEEGPILHEPEPNSQENEPDSPKQHRFYIICLEDKDYELATDGEVNK